MNRYKKANEGIHAPEKVKEKAVRPGQTRRYSRWMGAVAAVLAVAIIGGAAVWSGWSGQPDAQSGDGPNAGSRAFGLFPAAHASTLAAAKYPKQGDTQLDTDGMLDHFLTASTAEILSGAEEENRIYSPLNVYMALSMLAETTGGNSRQQIFDLLGVGSIGELRDRASTLWKAHYQDDDMTTSVLANSMWLADGLTYNQKVLNTLAKNYYASSFQGIMGSEEYDQLHRDWLNEQTRGLLKDQADKLCFDPVAVLGLDSTIYFKAAWQYPMWDGKTHQDVFHAPSGDVECEFMGKVLDGDLFWGDHFSAVELRFQDYEWSMWFILPDEGYTVDQLLESGEAMEFLTADHKYGVYDWDTEEVTDGWPNQKRLEIELSMPKFDVSSDMDLKDSLRALGVTDVFDSSANFNPLGAGDDVFVSQVKHAARVMVDEEGCTAAAYVDLELCGGSGPPSEGVEFTLDRPFLFAICGSQPTFIGVVNVPFS